MKPILVCCLALATVVGTVVLACGPMFPRAVFTYQRHPDFPRTEYLKGKLGVFQPTYARSYLVIAYRYLKGPALSATEQAQVKEYWKDRESGDWDRTAVDWARRWAAERAKVPGAAPLAIDKATQGVYAFQKANNAFVLNCAEDAFRTAVETLRARGAKFGFGSPAVKAWLGAQDTVFADCGGGNKIPEPAGADLPEVIRADREYQIAAAHFYAGQYGESEANFRRIASTDSPWRTMAPYLVVRSMARAAQVNPAGRPAAEAAANAVLADSTLAALHGTTRVLLHRMILQRRDEDYLHALARDLVSGREGRSFREELWDYLSLYDKFVGYDPWESKPPADPAVFPRDELSDWIYTYQRGSYRHAVARWKERHSLPWLIAALRHAGPGADEVMRAAAAVDRASPAFETVSFYRLKLLVDSGRKDEANAELDRILAGGPPPSSVNLFRSLRMRTAPTLDEFLSFAARTPVMLTTDWNEGQVPQPEDAWERRFVARAVGQKLLDRDSVKILNERTPLRLLRKAALGDGVPSYHRRDLVLSAFTRALLLDDAENGLPLAAKLAEIGADKQGYLAAYREAGTPEKRRFAGIFYVLHHPESRPYLSSGYGRMGRVNTIDAYRDNWWCPVNMKMDLDALTSGLVKREDPDEPAWSAAFLTAEDRQEAAAEMKKLATTHSGPDYLIAQTMAFARAHPRDPRVPEALHFALRSQRYGCVRKETAAAAETAWRYLWRRYPRNDWTRKSNYPFEGPNVPGEPLELPR